MLPKRNYAEMIIILLGVTWYCLGSFVSTIDRCTRFLAQGYAIATTLCDDL